MELRFTHCRLLVSDFVASFKFYKDVLGLSPQYGDERGPYVEFRTGAGILALFQRELMAEALGQPVSGKSGDQAVLGLQVADVDKAVEQLQRKGIRLAAAATDRPAWRIRTAHVRDPDGNLIELNAPLK